MTEKRTYRTGFFNIPGKTERMPLHIRPSDPDHEKKPESLHKPAQFFKPTRFNVYIENPGSHDYDSLVVMSLRIGRTQQFMTPVPSFCFGTDQIDSYDVQKYDICFPAMQIVMEFSNQSLVPMKIAFEVEGLSFQPVGDLPAGWVERWEETQRGYEPPETLETEAEHDARVADIMDREPAVTGLFSLIETPFGVVLSEVQLADGALMAIRAELNTEQAPGPSLARMKEICEWWHIMRKLPPYDLSANQAGTRR